ncbi:hypothetical protein YC2023_082454 [Brassica napus]
MAVELPVEGARRCPNIRIPNNDLGNADDLEFDRKCVRLLGCTGRRCICCNNAPEILKCYDTQAACMAHCTNPTI